MPDEATRRDWSWSDRHIPQIQAILGQQLITVAPPKMDQEENTDFIVMQAGQSRIACRIRREHYLYKNGGEYAHDVTVRRSRPSGAPTEYEKIKRGWGDLLFYGFGNDNGDVVRWVIVSLHRVRNMLIDSTEFREHMEKTRIPNGDGSSYLTTIPVNRFNSVVWRASDNYWTEPLAA